VPQARGGRGGPSTSCTRRRRAARARAGARTTLRRPTTAPPSRMAGAAASSALRPELALPGRLYAVMPQNPCALCLFVCGCMSAGVSALLRVAYSRQAAHAENDLECRVMHRACAGRPAVRCRGGRQGNQRSAITTRCSTAGAAVAIHRGAAQRQRGGEGRAKLQANAWTLERAGTRPAMRCKCGGCYRPRRAQQSRICQLPACRSSPHKMKNWCRFKRREAWRPQPGHSP